jgi:PKD repeat protein
LADGSVIPCTDYTVTAASNLPGFQYCAPAPPDTAFVAWRDWTEVAVDLSAYVGQSVSLEFETGDCRLRGHYGYAYIDAVQCGQATNHITYCENDTTLTINGLGGFASYEWQTGDTTQSVTINPQLYDTITCTVTTFLGCELTLYYVLDMAPGFPNFTYTPGCEGPIEFTSTSSASYSPINYLWTFPDGTTSTSPNPTHTFTAGTWPVTLQISSDSGCGRDTTIMITVYETPQPDFIAPNVCVGNPTQFTNLTPSISGQNMTYNWNFGDNTQSTEINPNHIYLSVGNYNVTLTATTTFGCAASVQNQVSVYSTPIITGQIIHN